MTFWDHLDELRSVIIRLLVVSFIAFTIAFALKDQLFYIILAPLHPGFITYQWLDTLLAASPLPQLSDAIAQQPAGATDASAITPLTLISTELSQQFLIHVEATAIMAILAISPYIIYELFRYISPALYAKERRYTLWIVLGSYIMFIIGILFSYLIIFPFTFRFLATYQVDPSVTNTITLESYINTLATLTLVMGIIFQMPMLSWLLGRFGLLTRQLMRRYRRHMIVAILILAAVITPTGDIFTLLVVALPMYLLYEISIILVPAKKRPISPNRFH